MNRKATILSVDDDEGLQTVLSTYFEGDGYKVLNARSFKAAQEQSGNPAIDVILLDLGLPDGEGLALIPQIKAMSKAGIIVVSGKNDTTEKIVCLEMGADDFITKPFEMRELAARIKAVLRRATAAAQPAETVQEQQPERIIFGDWRLDRAQFQLFFKDGTSAELTTGEFRMLEALVTNPNRVLSRETLFDLTREGRFDAFDRAIDIQIARLRKKIEPDANDPKLIKTVRGAGYMFVPPEDAQD